MYVKNINSCYPHPERLLDKKQQEPSLVSKMFTSNISDQRCVLPMILQNGAKPGSYNTEVCARQRRSTSAAGEIGQQTFL